MSKISIVVADDHPVIRYGLELVLSQRPGMELLAMASNGVEAVQHAQRYQPDVLIMDIQMPVMDGLEAIEAIADLNIPSKIIVLTGFHHDDRMVEAVRLGAVAVIEKNTDPEDLIKIIYKAAQGINVLNPNLVRKLIMTDKQPLKRIAIEDTLTQREVEVLHIISQGKTNEEIAVELDVSPRTVTTHVGNILAKLQVDNRTQAALFALELYGNAQRIS